MKHWPNLVYVLLLVFAILGSGSNNLTWAFVSIPVWVFLFPWTILLLVRLCIGLHRSLRDKTFGKQLWTVLRWQWIGLLALVAGWAARLMLPQDDPVPYKRIADMSAQAAPAARPAMPTPDDAAWASSAAAPELAAAFVGGYKLSCHDDRLRARQHLVLIAADGSGSIDGVGVVDARHAGTVVLASDHRYFLQRDQGLQNGNSVPGDSLGLDFSAAADAAAAGAAAARNGIAIITNGSHIEYCTVVAGAPGADRFDITGLLRHLPQPYAVSCAIDTTTGYRWGAPRSFTVAANGDVMLAAGDYKRQAGDKVVSGGHWPATEYRTGSGYWRVEESRSFRATDARITPRYRLRISLGNAQDETLSVTYGAVVDANPDLEIGPVIGQAETIKASTCLSAQWLRREGLR